MTRTVALLIFVAFTPLAYAADEAAPRIAIIVHPWNPLPSLAVKEIEGIFLLERLNWIGDSRITPVSRPWDTELNRIFFKRVLPEYRDDLPDIYRDTGKRVKIVNSDNEAIAAVASDPSAVAYVWEQSLVSKVRAIAFLELENPDEGVAPARTARLMGTLRELWDQLAGQLANRRVPVEDLQLIANAVAEESVYVTKLAPTGQDPSVLEFLRLADELRVQTQALPKLMRRRADAIRAMGKIEKTICFECHRSFRQ